MKNVYTRLVIIGIVLVIFVVLAYPPKEKIKLGLDLKGGMHLVLKVLTTDAIKSVTDQTILDIQSELKDKEVKYEDIERVDYNSFAIKGFEPAAEQQINLILKNKLSRWNYTPAANKIIVDLKQNIEKELKDQSVEQAKETIKNRIDQYGVAEPIIQRQGLTAQSDIILVELPGVEDPGRVKGLIKSTAMLEQKIVIAGPASSKEQLLKDYNGEVPDNGEILPGFSEDGSRQYYLLEKVTAVSGRDIRDARVSRDQYGAPAVFFRLNREGADKFKSTTQEHKGDNLAIVLDGVVQTAPTIRDVIYDSGTISGGAMTYEEASDLALKLRSGSLPAKIRILEERTIGPSLGADSVRKGLKAMLIGFLLVIIFIILYYRLSGINAVTALILNIIIIMGALAYFDAALTLPGIAGIILTIGMSVDANVLIFERIREDIKTGKTPKASIDEGFKKAFITILDANLTTIIAAIFLFQFGTGPIKGFAITLIIGITASMFTAVYVSRTIFELYFVMKRRVEKLSI